MVLVTFIAAVEVRTGLVLRAAARLGHTLVVFNTHGRDSRHPMVVIDRPKGGRQQARRQNGKADKTVPEH